MNNLCSNSASERPTGIIRTLVSHVERDEIPAVYISLQAVPKCDVLHLYLVGEIW